MSCITQILKLKGDQEILMTFEKNGKPWVAVEGGGTYKDYEYLITFTEMGHRCGYVAIPSEHPFSNSKKTLHPFEENKIVYDWNTLKINCHGGLTFMSSYHNLKDLLSVKCEDIWIGFDCAHAFDGKDMKLVEKYYGENNEMFKFYVENPEYLSREFEPVREFKYVEKECKKIIRQLIKKAA